MLAVELARRMAAEGRSVLISCFNRELGLWLERNCKAFGPGSITAGHLHRILRPRLDQAGLLEEAQASASGTAWYEAGALAVAASDERFDTLIVDEAQDFPAGPLLDLLEVWRRAPSAVPGICLFADFSRQALYVDPDAASSLIRQRMHPAAFRLRRNCRNTRKITAETALLTGSFDLKVAADQPAGPAVERLFFDAPGQQSRVLDRALQQLSQ